MTTIFVGANGTECGKCDSSISVCDIHSGFCTNNATTEKGCVLGGGYFDNNRTCICAADFVWSENDKQCMPAYCDGTAAPGYYHTWCPTSEACINNVCIDPKVNVHWDNTCNSPTIWPPGRNCMTAYDSGCYPNSGSVSVEKEPDIKTSLRAAPIATPGVLVLDNGDQVQLTPLNLLNNMLTWDNSKGANVTCNEDPTLNMSTTVGTGMSCYHNTLINDADETTPQEFLTGIGSTPCGGGPNGIIEFYTSDSNSNMYYAGTNVGNFPRQSELFIMFANAENVSWITPNVCSMDAGDTYSPCAVMGGGMRCVPGTTPIMVSNCDSPDPLICTDKWYNIAHFVNGATLQPSSNGSPTLFSVWQCSAESATAAMTAGGTACPPGFVEGIIYDENAHKYSGTCVRAQQYNNGGSKNGLAWNYCNHYETRDGGCQTVGSDSCNASSGEGAMCWETVCEGSEGMVANDIIPYIPVGYAYITSDVGNPYKVCSESDNVFVDVNNKSYLSKGCTDIQRTWHACCDGYKTGYGTDCGSDSSDKVWIQGGNANCSQ